MRAKYFLLVLMLFGLPARGVESPAAFPEIVATVNEASIGRAQFEARIAQSRSMNPQLFDAMPPEERSRAIVRVLNAMVLRELQVQEAQRRGLVVEAAEVDRQLRELERAYANKGGVPKALAEFRITLNEWREETRRNVLVRKFEAAEMSRIVVTDEEIRDEFMRNFWHEKTPPSAADINEHRDHMRMVIQERRWAERRKPWLESLVQAAKIWRWTPDGNRLAGQ